MSDSTAESIVRDLGITRPQDIDLDAIAYTLGVFVRYRLLDRCEAMIVGAGDKAVATINTRSMPEKQRFSLGHEIGHWIRHKGQTLYCLASEIEGDRDPRIAKEFELIADNFSASLLMPEYLFSPLLLQIGTPNWKKIGDLAKEFRASHQATALRVVDLSSKPMMFILVRNGRRAWFHRPARVAARCFPKEYPESASRALAMSLDPKSAAAGARKLRADTWFDFRGAERLELTEDCVRYGEDTYALLTLDGIEFLA